MSMITLKVVIFTTVAWNQETKRRVWQSEAVLRSPADGHLWWSISTLPLHFFPITQILSLVFLNPPPSCSPTGTHTAGIELWCPRNQDEKKWQNPFHPIIPAAAGVTQHLHWHLLPGHMCAQATCPTFRHTLCFSPTHDLWYCPLSSGRDSKLPLDLCNPRINPVLLPKARLTCVTFPSQTSSGSLPGHCPPPRAFLVLHYLSWTIKISVIAMYTNILFTRHI